MNNVFRLRVFIQDFTRLVEAARGNEQRLLQEGGRLLQSLVKQDDWLPEE